MTERVYVRTVIPEDDMETIREMIAESTDPGGDAAIHVLKYLMGEEAWEAASAEHPIDTYAQKIPVAQWQQICGWVIEVGQGVV